jgi:hypothetical protein
LNIIAICGDAQLVFFELGSLDAKTDVRVEALTPVVLVIVLRPPGQNIAAAHIGIVVAAFGVVYGFEVFEAGAVLAVFNATG